MSLHRLLSLLLNDEFIQRAIYRTKKCNSMTLQQSLYLFNEICPRIFPSILSDCATLYTTIEI